MKDKIKIVGARMHNLKNISLELPKNKIIIISGVSGSGKSSLAYDTIFAEGQRRYIESLSPYARQFLGQMPRPEVDEIAGLSPAIAIDQKAHTANPRSIVATLTEIYDYLRVLYARIGKPHCPVCQEEIKKMSVEEMTNLISLRAKKGEVIKVLSPVVRGRKGEYYQLLYDLLALGFDKARIDGKEFSLHERINLSRYKNHSIEVVVDETTKDDQSRLFEGIETALKHSKGLLTAVLGKEEITLSSQWSCPKDDFSFPEIEPRLFSFNSPYGACPVCSGLGKEFLWGKTSCPVCRGKRLKPESLAVKISGKNIMDVIGLSIDRAAGFFAGLKENLKRQEMLIAEGLLKEISSRLNFLLEVGLDYITLDREAGTLSAGEAQRIRLASQIGSKLSGTLYVLDEPTIGLHERDNERLVKTLKELRDLGNTVIVVEHDERTIKASDHLVDLGEGPGIHGGEVVAEGELKDLLKSKKTSPTLDFLKGKEKMELPKFRRSSSMETLKVIGAKANNIRGIEVEVPLRRLVALTGVSGSGKSTLLHDIIYKNLRLGPMGPDVSRRNAKRILGSQYINKTIIINQSPIGRTPRSNPATYTGVFTPIRELFALLPESREKGYRMSRFSFNVSGGRCEACQGAGSRAVEMHFLPTIFVPCDVCQGTRFNSQALEIKYQGKNISEVLAMSVEEALKFFKEFPQIEDKLKVLNKVGLGYIKLGQSATTLSGGEAQRIKLSKELSKGGRGNLYLLDEPTTGLHFRDVKALLAVLNELVDRGNTVLVIEHNLYVIRAADYVIDLGPEGGERGGRIVAAGTPEEIVQSPGSYTGRYLKNVL